MKDYIADHPHSRLGIVVLDFQSVNINRHLAQANLRSQDCAWGAAALPDDVRRAAQRRLGVLVTPSRAGASRAYISRRISGRSRPSP